MSSPTIVSPVDVEEMDAGATPVASVRRVAAIFDAFLSAPRELGVADLATELRLSKSVVHRLVRALADTQYLVQDAATRRYSLGPKAIRLGLSAMGQSDTRARVLAHLRALAEATSESATFSVLAGDHRVYAEQIESIQNVRQTVQLGQSAPLHLGASGKAILAFLPRERWDDALRAAGPSRTHADGSPLVPEELWADLCEVRERGFAVSRSERVLGAASAAAPVFDFAGHVLGSISIAGVTIRQDQAQLEEFGRLVRRHGQELSTELGWPGPEAPER